MLREFSYSLLCLTIVTWNPLWRLSDSLAIWFCGLDSAQRSISISITHFDPVTMKTSHLLVHSHFARILHRQRASKITYRIVVFFNFLFLVLVLFLYIFLLFVYFYAETSPLPKWPLYVCRPEQLKREGSLSMHSNGLRWRHSFH